MKKSVIALSVVVLAIGLFAFAQPPRFGPPGREHTVTKAGKLRLIPATATPSVTSQVEIVVEGDQRVIRANGVPDHKTGAFPNRGNPNRLSAQKYVYKIPAKPTRAQEVTPLRMQSFGIAINGVPFDPGAAEFYRGQRGTKWQYEPLSGAIALGIDVSHAHVQPTGAYHYHGLPTKLLSEVKLEPDKHSPIIGWAADGFPMYAVYGFTDPKSANSSIIKMTSSYRLIDGNRPGGGEPNGKYDGSFVGDYEYVAGAGSLDQCNGRLTVTPDFPDGTYAYFLTEDWPVIPRKFRGKPSKSFERRGPPPGAPRGRRPPPRFRPPRR